MSDWVISKPDKAAYVDLRGNELSFGGAERLLDAIQLYYPSRQLQRIVIDARGLDPLPGPVDVLIVAIETQAASAGIGVEVVREDPPL